MPRVIHRDVKPANILIVDRGGISDLVKVVDFGLLKDVGFTAPGEATSAPALTRASVPYTLCPVLDLTALDAAAYADNPTLKIPNLVDEGGPLFGAENIYRKGDERASRESPRPVQRATSRTATRAILPCCSWELNAKGSPRVLGGFHVDRSIVGEDDLLNDVESEPKAVARALSITFECGAKGPSRCAPSMRRRPTPRCRRARRSSRSCRRRARAWRRVA